MTGTPSTMASVNGVSGYETSTSLARRMAATAPAPAAAGNRSSAGGRRAPFRGKRLSVTGIESSRAAVKRASCSADA